MPSDSRSSQLAEALSSLWSEAKTPEFAAYISQVYRLDVSERPDFRCIYIGETEDGDLARGPAGGLIKQWWMVDEQGFREVRAPNMDWEGESSFYPTPRLLFYRQGDGITISERLGQRMACRKSGQFHVHGDRITIVDLKLLDLC